MKILDAAQIRECDRYTIANEPIASIDLMERAANAITDWLFGRYCFYNRPFTFLPVRATTAVTLWLWPVS